MSRWIDRSYASLNRILIIKKLLPVYTCFTFPRPESLQDDKDKLRRDGKASRITGPKVYAFILEKESLWCVQKRRLSVIEEPSYF